ncbi:MAG: CsbD family protein [Cyanobacteria bacterium]|nr:CsbD family protein [Cyanobacteriota bacterium]
MEIIARQLVAILKGSTVKLLAGLICMASWMLMPLPAMAMANNYVHTPQILATMAQKMDAKAKETEGKVQSAYGEITGKPGEQIKGKVKQVQGSAKGAQQDIKQGVKSMANKASDAAGNLADKLS